MASSEPLASALHPGRAPLIAAVALGAGVVIGLWSGTGRTPATPALTPLATRLMPEPALASLVVPAAMTRAVRTGAQPVARPEGVPGPAAEGQTAGEFLAGYYGARWPEVRARIEAAGQVSLDTPYVYTPWEDVELEFQACLDMSDEARTSLVRNKLQWPAELSTAFLREEYSLSPERWDLTEVDLDEIRTRIEQKNQELVQRAELFAQKLDFYVHEKWYDGTYVRAPFTTSGLAGSGFHSQSHAGYGWAATITLTYEEYPDMQELDQEMRALVDQRDAIVVEYLRSRIRR